MDKEGKNTLSPELTALMQLQDNIRAALLEAGCPMDLSLELAAAALYTVAESGVFPSGSATGNGAEIA